MAGYRGQFGLLSPWLCRIRWRDLATVVVPLRHRDGARCGRLELVRRLTWPELKEFADKEAADNP